MEFVSGRGAVAGLRSNLITFSTDEASPSKTIVKHHEALNVIDEVTVPPRSSGIAHVDTRGIKNRDGII